jgi:hypothetical protein
VPDTEYSPARQISPADSAHFVDGFVGMLQDVERPPHVHASRRNVLPLNFSQLDSGKLIERLLLWDRA